MNETAIETIDLTVITVDSPAKFPGRGRLVEHNPERGVVYVYHAPHQIGGQDHVLRFVPVTDTQP
jgi:hypothetical protein